MQDKNGKEIEAGMVVEISVEKDKLSKINLDFEI